METRTRELTGSWLGLFGRRLWVERAGQGPAVVLCHAAIGDRRMWDGPLAAVADRYEVVCYDQPGFGRSTPAAEPFSYVEELDAVLDHVGADHAVLVGCSMGGRVVLDYALAHSERVAALVPVAAVVSGQRLSLPGRRELAAAVMAGDQARIAEVALRIWAPLRTDPGVDARIRQLVVENVSGIATMGAMWRDGPSACGRLHEVAAPTLVVVGDRDQPDHVRTAKLLAAGITGARLAVLAVVDHNVPVRAGRASTDLLASFLDQLDNPHWRRLL